MKYNQRKVISLAGILLRDDRYVMSRLLTSLSLCVVKVVLVAVTPNIRYSHTLNLFLFPNDNQKLRRTFVARASGKQTAANDM